MMQRILLAVMLCALGPVLSAWAGSNAALVGTWSGDFAGEPFQMILNADGTGQMDGPIQWQVQGGKLVIAEADGATTYNFLLKGSKMTVSGGDLEAPLTLTRAGAASRAPEPPASKQTASSSELVSNVSAPASGPHYQQAQWGVSFSTPAQWFVTDKQVALLMASNTEPGLMIVRFLRKTTADKLRTGYAEGLAEDGVRLMPVSQLQTFPVGKLQGLAGELAGLSNQGQRLKARIIGVPTPFGDAAVVLGVTTEDKYPRLKATTDALAASLGFAQPKATPVRELLAGRYEFFSGHSTYSGSYSRQAKLSLCANGAFYSNSETSSSGTGGLAGVHGGGGGTWTADGDEFHGTAIVTYPNGQRETYEYVVSMDPKDRSYYGPAVSFGGTKYQRTGDGNCR
jgi:hypothetical protein